MLPARFEYHRPATLEDALALIGDLGDDAKVLAGGQSLIPLLKLRLAAPEHLVDINRIEGLDGVEERDGALRIGALTRHHTLESSDLIAARYPTIAAAAPMIADPLVRNLGTIGGSLAHADPAGDLGSVMLSLGGRFGAPSASASCRSGSSWWTRSRPRWSRTRSSPRSASRSRRNGPEART